jgi:hypothetical protein
MPVPRERVKKLNGNGLEEKVVKGFRKKGKGS